MLASSAARAGVILAMEARSHGRDRSDEIAPDLLLAHAGALRALAYGLLGDEHAAEDVLQDTFVRALVAPPPERDRLGGWLRRVTEGFALKRRRSEARRTERERRYAADRPEATDPQAPSREEALRRVVEAVLALAEPYRETVLSRYFEGLPPREIARRSGAPLATVQSRLTRAHALLRERLERELGPRRGGARGTLLALLGLRSPPPATLAASGTGGATAWKAALLLAAGVIGIALVPLLQRPERADAAQPVLASGAASEASDEPVLPEPLERREERASEPAREERRAERSGLAAGAVDAGPYEFDLEVVPIDEHGRPLASVRVLLGPNLHALVDLGTTAWNGRLRTRWRGFEPALDLVVCAGREGFGASPLRRLHLRAGAPQRIVVGLEPWGGGHGRLPGEAPRYKIAVAESLSRKARIRTSLDLGSGGSAPGFALDEAGNGLFTDPWLLSGPVVPPQSVQEPLRERLALQESRTALKVRAARLDAELVPFDAEFVLVGESFSIYGADDGSQPPWARISGVAMDERGEPVAGVRITAVAESHAWRTDGASGADGRFALGVPPGPVELWVGGGERGIEHASFELVPGESIPWNPSLARGEVLRARLVDEAGQALAGWYVEACEPFDSPAFLARATTDAEGRFAIAGLSAAPLRLLARPGDLEGRPKLVAAETLFPGASEQIVVVRGDLSPSSIELEPALPDGEELAEAEARLWRLDSGEGVRLLRLKGAEGEHTPLRLGGDGLLPGMYALEVVAPGCAWKRLDGIRLSPSSSVDLGRVQLASGRLALEREGPPPHRAILATLWTLSGGARLRSEDRIVNGPCELRATPGEHELRWQALDDKRPHGEAQARRVELAPGVRLEIDLSPAGARRWPF
jgi:RNA polymerase sigma factor (sigma-70 family)